MDLLRAQLAKNLGCAGEQESGSQVQDLERRELHILRQLVAANAPPNLETPGVDGTERSRKWNELREIQESIANKKQRVRQLVETFCDKAGVGGEVVPRSPSRTGTPQA